MSGTAPLAGLRIVEFASFVAGPSAGLALAQLGAQVIRVDPLGGNADYRRWPLSERTGESLYWNSLNRDKLSVALNLREPAGRELLLALATAPGADAGIVLDNAVGRAWLSYEELAARRPDVISVKVTGRADGGAAVDYTVNAAAGVAGLTGPAGTDDPVNHVLPAWDLLCGQQAATALLAALRRRDRTGEGARIEIALEDVALAAVANLGWYSEARERGDRARHGNHLYGAFGVDFATGDGGRVMTVVLTARQWAALGAATGMTEQLAALGQEHGADLDTDEGRYALRHEIAALLAPWFAGHSTAQVHAALTAAGVLWGPYRTPAQVARDVTPGGPLGPVLTELHQPGIGPVISAGAAARVGGRYSGTRPARALGADTAQVLSEVLGLSAGRIAGLADAGLI